jgi:copper chaperone CopZ
MPTTNFQDRAGSPQNRGRVIGLVLGTVVLGIFLGAYFLIRTAKEQPQVLVAEPQAKTVTMPIEGMTCASCVAQVKRTLKSMDGVTGVEVSLEHRHAEVRYVDAKVSPERLAAAINELGYKAGTPTIERTR